MDGIVACETLYTELPAVAPDAEIRYVSQWYHEFPIHAPESEKGHAALQERIDELEAAGVDRVLVIYHDPDALAGLQTESVPLLVYRGRDCIDLQLNGEAAGPGGERKAGATYYLTRGWIDVAVDSYKVYRAYAGELEDLLADFEAARAEIPGMRVSWPDSEKVQQAQARSEGMQTDPAALVRTVLDSYRHVALIDTGHLEPFHHEYAEAVRAFFAEIVPEEGPRDVDLEVVPGTLDHLKRIVGAPDAVPEVLAVDPGEPVPAETGFRTGPQHH
jgi:hypothetical protein